MVPARSPRRAMSLVGPGSQIPADQLRAIFAEHREEIVGLSQSLETPPRPIVDPGRWENGRGLAGSALRVLPERAEAIPDEALPAWVNLSYEVMVALVYLMKAAYGLPSVPSRRT